MMNGIIPLRLKDHLDKLPKTIYVQIFSLDELPPFYNVVYDCGLYTTFRSSFNQDVLFYYLKR